MTRGVARHVVTTLLIALGAFSARPRSYRRDQMSNLSSINRGRALRVPYGDIPALDAMKRKSDTLYARDKLDAAEQVGRRLQRVRPQHLATTSTNPGCC